ncbi:PAS domain-containing protein [Mesorhizobium sp. LHD-90]|uniref:PAS domain-containing hybrid sensor histidine kinase/response regulator n=1 Tax=Mesorhizobium sp. LHD-90 TaxID=3071414 RepID=UPI0027E09A78|nr:PAS domain-containing protein [Mesorhizobium sp. LHD-90]MDQ6432581.1 PAS domain-containing protein [Mesorhizobium sp. LHD-90]
MSPTKHPEPAVRLHAAGQGVPLELSSAEAEILIDADAGWVWETDIELQFSWLSASYATTTGQAAEAMLGRAYPDALGLRDDTDMVAVAHLADLKARRPFRDFVCMLAGARPDCRWVSMTGFPRVDDAGKFAGYRGIARNITGVAATLSRLNGAAPLADRVNETPSDAETVPDAACMMAALDHATSQSERLLSDLKRTIDSLDLGVVLLDADLNTEIINKAFYAIWSLAPDALPVGRPFRSLIDSNRRTGIYGVADAEWETYVASRLAEIKAGDVEPRQLVRADGKTLIYSVTALSGGKRLISYFDITEMKRRERELAEAHERSRLAEAVIETIKDPIFIKDSDLKFVLVNQAFASICGATAEAMIGTRGGDYVSDTEGHRFETSERAVLETGEPFEIEEDFEFAGIGRTRIVRKSRVDTENGKQYIAGLVFDVSQLKARETEAEEARRRLADVLESLPAAVIIYDRDDKFVLANRKLQDTLPALKDSWLPDRSLRHAIELAHSVGYFRDSGDPELDALYDSDRDGWVELYLKRYHQPHLVTERLNPDGRWFKVYDTRTREGSFIGVRVDVTDLKERETSLRESMRQIELFSRVLDEMPVATNIKSERLTLEYVNRAWCELTGYSREDAIGKSDLELFGAGEASGFTADDTYVATTGSGIEAEEAVTSRNGAVMHVMTRKGRLTTQDGLRHVFGCSTDISDIKRREALLQQSLRENEVFRSLIDNVPTAIYAKKPDLELVYVNKGWSDLTGISRHDAIGRTDVQLFGQDGEAFAKADLEVLRTGETQVNDETVLLKDGSTRHQLARKSAFAASDGSLYLIGSSVDVSEQKRHEAELREARRRAELADRAKSEFLANMSHEIRTPMNGVLGMAELLARSDLDPKQKTFTDIIVKSGNALLTIINDILDFSKIDAGELVLDAAPFRLSDAIEDVATLLSARAKEKDLELIIRVAPDLKDTYVGDVGRIRQIVTNLIGNAIKFTDAGHVLVEARNGVGTDGTNLRMSVTDTGIGIPPDKLGTVFEKFSQVDASSTRRHEGTGLGLAITSRLVGLMGGTVGVESVEGQGSTFSVTLSLPEAEMPAPTRGAPADVTGARVLVVDDNAVNRTILLEQMSNWRFDACAASSGGEGLQVLAAATQLGLSVDCVVLDYQMPGMNGFDFVRVIRGMPSLADTPVVLLTSVDLSLGASAMRDMAIDAQLTKPVRASALLEAVTSIILQGRGRKGTRVVEAARLPGPEAARSIGETEANGRTVERDDATPHRVDILVAEDNDVNQLVFTQILSDAGYTFQIVGNGRLAVEAFREMRPMMVLMDVSMPEMNGFEATAAIRSFEASSGGHTPIIGVTAHALRGDRERCLEAGMDDYLSKPISPRALQEKLERWSSAPERQNASSVR